MYFGELPPARLPRRRPRTPELLRWRARAADRLGLAFEHRHVGLGELATSIEAFAAGAPIHVSGRRRASPGPAGAELVASPRRGPLMATMTVIWWRDIPAQVIARDGRRSSKVVLHPRFQVAIDKAASRAGKRSYSDYIEEWRKVAGACGDDIEAEA